MKMKKTLLPLFLALVAFVFAGCGGEKLNISLADAGNQLLQQQQFTDQLTELVSEDACTLYGIENDDIVDAIAYVSSGATAEEISLWQAKDSKSLKNITDAIEARMASQKDAYASYKPEEVPKLETYILKTAGDYAVLCVTDDTDAAESILTDLGF